VLFCVACGLGQLAPRPSASVLEQLYSESYFSHDSNEVVGYADYAAMEPEHRQGSRRLLAAVGAVKQPPGALFDVGCGFGYFLEVAELAGWTVSGSDVSPAAVRAAGARMNSVVCAPMEALTGSYDVVTAWDVLEHVQDPLVGLRRVRDALNPGGVLALTTPDTDSWDARLLGGRWYGYTKIPEHLFYFNRRSIRQLLELAGLELIACRPWGFVRSGKFLADRLGHLLGGHPLPMPRAVEAWLGERALFIPAIDLFATARRAG
jgi:2-polyprenyl-3-methyl-5-hydroxy-6-metoxy-1,4-benzoquinol methylase